MKLIQIIFLLTVSSNLLSQDTIGNKKKNFLVVNCNYLYNQYLGQKTFELYPGATVTKYTYYTTENTSGLLASLSFRHYLADHSAIQVGIGFRNTVSSYLHTDSIVTEQQPLK